MSTKKCYRCGEEKDICLFFKDKSRKSGLANSCKECDRLRKYNKHSYSAEWQRQYADKHRIKIRARRTLQRALENGKVIKTSCVVCGEKIVQGHHNDYEKPLDVIWLCSTHHSQLHRGQIFL